MQKIMITSSFLKVHPKNVSFISSHFITCTQCFIYWNSLHCFHRQISWTISMLIIMHGKLIFSSCIFYFFNYFLYTFLFLLWIKFDTLLYFYKKYNCLCNCTFYVTRASYCFLIYNYNGRNWNSMTTSFYTYIWIFNSNIYWILYCN